MNIELLDEKRVLIDLCVEDMQLLSLEYKNLSMQSLSNRKVINNLVRIAKIKTGFHTEESTTVLVEAMPYEGGCFILITLKENYSSKNKKYRVVRKMYRRMFIFDDCESMLSAVEKIYPYHTKVSKSTLVVCDKKYYLIISTQNNVNATEEVILSEFSKRKAVGNIEIALILEHSQIICENNAIEKIGKALCNVDMQNAKPIC